MPQLAQQEHAARRSEGSLVHGRRRSIGVAGTGSRGRGESSGCGQVRTPRAFHGNRRLPAQRDTLRRHRPREASKTGTDKTAIMFKVPNKPARWSTP